MKTSFFFIIFFILVFDLNQTFAQSNTSLGLRIGPNIASLTGDDANNDGSRIGLALGGFFTYSTSETFGITGELLYSQKGNKRDTPSGEVTRKLDYLDVPIYANYFLTTSGDFRPKLMLGPTFSFLLNSEREDANGNSVEINNNNEFDLGVLAGIGFHYSLGNATWLNFDARYTLGLVSISQDDTIDVRNQNISIMLGISFGLQ